MPVGRATTAGAVGLTTWRWFMVVCPSLIAWCGPNLEDGQNSKTVFQAERGTQACLTRMSPICSRPPDVRFREVGMGLTKVTG